MLKVDIGATFLPSRYFTGVLAHVPEVSLRNEKTEGKIWAACLYSDKLECLDSQYQVAEELWQDATVILEQVERGKLLQSIYETPAIREIMQEPAFLEARSGVLLRRQSPRLDFGWWSDERGLLASGIRLNGKGSESFVPVASTWHKWAD